MATNLYEVIGGRTRIQETVSVFYDRVLADPRLRPFFENTDMEALRTRQSMFLTMLLGGTRTYGGRDIREAHAGARAMGLNHSHFDLLMDHFSAALTESGVDDKAIAEILARLEATRKEVLGG
jgi:hemoglobin